MRAGFGSSNYNKAPTIKLIKPTLNPVGIFLPAANPAEDFDCEDDAVFDDDNEVSEADTKEVAELFVKTPDDKVLVELEEFLESEAMANKPFAADNEEAYATDDIEAETAESEALEIEYNDAS
ncbi:hypothetical protein WICMUC_005387 [Wickerhamomyces mucosus]|uniref:Uncharacterized protein n=1 Tax=Wickerhamomyces mucosus TaxID=1378264 RepID=A0A9P8T6F4_9ASCO|nr:hypothetical protein WICMUC_005387 [Wickerhamomyces mucosus]